MDFFKTIRSSFYDPAFYERVRKEEPFSVAKVFGYLGVMGVGILLASMYAFLLVPVAFMDIPAKIVSYYPADLVVTIANGQMSINQPQPYYIKNPFPKTGVNDRENLIVFDGEDKLPTDLKKASTFILVKKTFVISDGENNQQRFGTFSDIKATTTLSREVVSSVAEKVRPYVKPVVLGGGLIFVILGTIIGAFFWVIFHMIYILIPALLVFLFTYLRQQKMKFKESYMVTAYATIPVAIISLGFTLAHFPLPPYVYGLLVLLIAAVNLANNQKTPVQSV